MCGKNTQNAHAFFRKNGQKGKKRKNSKNLLTNGFEFSIIAGHLTGRELRKGAATKENRKSRKTFLRNFKKGVDKRETKWYNKRVAGTEGLPKCSGEIGL